MQDQGKARHRATPRVLVFPRREGRWLLIRGASHKWWAGRWNGLGGSVETGESVLAAALREVREETGLEAREPELAAVGHLSVEPPVMLFVFTASLADGEPGVTDEGELRFFAARELGDPDLALMPDLPVLLPRLLARKPGAPPFFFSGTPDEVLLD